jgi:hypothetical protein
MYTTFYDERIVRNPFNGTRVGTAEEVFALFDALPKDEPFICKLEGENGYEILIGVGNTHGCIQYARSDGEPPYMVTVLSRGDDIGEYREFRLGNELTQVPERRCLPMERIKEVVAYFVETGERSPNVLWEEV